MCINCYQENGSPSIINEKTLKAAKLINKIYEQDDCGAGGCAHIVTDDWNLSDSDIDYCLNDAQKKQSDSISEESTMLCIECLKYLKQLTLEERYSAMALHSGFIIYTQGTQPGNEVVTA